METKDKILKYTFALLLRKGYDGVSISDIQSATGISRGLLYHYFGNKKRLFIETIKENFITNFRIDLNLIEDYGLEQMTNYIIDKYKRLNSEILQGISILNYDFLHYRAMQESEELVKLYTSVRDDELKGWFLVLGNARRNGELKDGTDIPKLAQQYIYITDGVWLNAVTPSTTTELITNLAEALNCQHTLIKR